MSQPADPQQALDSRRVKKTIERLGQNIPAQPALFEIAGEAGLSPHHFQRLFKKWTGISPTQYLQHLTAAKASQDLKAGRTVEESAHRWGLSGSGRLHDLMVKLEGITPGQARNAAKGLDLIWGVADSPIGPTFLAFFERGVTALHFIGQSASWKGPLALLEKRWPNALTRRDDQAVSSQIQALFGDGSNVRTPISLWVSGTAFQLQVWRALLTIPHGSLSTYGHLAAALGKSGASRAVGNAVGKNPVALLIPCHRVIRKNGELGGYAWGLDKKKALLAMEEG